MRLINAEIIDQLDNSTPQKTFELFIGRVRIRLTKRPSHIAFRGAQQLSNISCYIIPVVFLQIIWYKIRKF